MMSKLTVTGKQIIGALESDSIWLNYLTTEALEAIGGSLCGWCGAPITSGECHYGEEILEERLKGERSCDSAERFLRALAFLEEEFPEVQALKDRDGRA